MFCVAALHHKIHIRGYVQRRGPTSQAPMLMDIINSDTEIPSLKSDKTSPKVRLGLVIFVISEAAILRSLVCGAQPRTEPQEHNGLRCSIVIKSIQEDL